MLNLRLRELEEELEMARKMQLPKKRVFLILEHNPGLIRDSLEMINELSLEEVIQ